MTRESDGSKEPLVAVYDYYTRSFLEFHDVLRDRGFDLRAQPGVRRDYWNLISPGRYPLAAGRELVIGYLQRVEKALGVTLARQSIAYWLHILRRLAPSYPDAQPVTVGLVRTSLETGIRKYSKQTFCDRIGWSNAVPTAAILSGSFERLATTDELQRVTSSEQLVLTAFGPDELEEFYRTEQLAYEVWRCGATLRILGKGAPLLVTGDSHGFTDDRGHELDTLVTRYDQRHGAFDHTLTGTTFGRTDTNGGWCLEPTYNVGGLSSDDMPPAIWKRVGFKLEWPGEFNFLWTPFDLRSFYESHKPFEEAFRKAKGVRLRDVLVVIGTLLTNAALSWDNTSASFFRDWQRAYWGPVNREGFMTFLENDLILGKRTLGLHPDEPVDIPAAVDYLTLCKPEELNVCLGGPMSVFLPIDDGQVFVDFAWIHRLLYFMFFGVRIPDENFKGPLLEEFVRRGKSVLTTDDLKNDLSEKHQVDASFDLGKTLVIVECKAIGNSIAFERGDQEAIAFRNDRIDEALGQVDKTAQWLSVNPVGTNYDIRGFDYVMPVVVTPFVEFLPSLAPKYWVGDNLPRVMTPRELRDALDTGRLAEPNLNAVLVSKS